MLGKSISEINHAQNNWELLKCSLHNSSKTGTNLHTLPTNTLFPIQEIDIYSYLLYRTEEIPIYATPISLKESNSCTTSISGPTSNLHTNTKSQHLSDFAHNPFVVGEFHRWAPSSKQAFEIVLGSSVSLVQVWRAMSRARRSRTCARFLAALSVALATFCLLLSVID